MIKRFLVDKLFDKISVELSFHDDLNVITGRNGSGKTTLLKLMWYMLSSNLERTVPEVNFRFAELLTDTFSVSLRRPRKRGKTGGVEIVWNTGGKKKKVLAPEVNFGNPACKV